MFGYDLDELEKLSNCLFFAVALFCRRLVKGERGYFTMRKSDYGRFPHFLYVRVDPLGKERFVSFVPNEPIPRDFPPPFFKGHVQWGDPKPTKGCQRNELHDCLADCMEHVVDSNAPCKHYQQTPCRKRQAPGKRIKITR